MEISIGDYGRMMFEMMIGKSNDLPDHWLSIKADAEPLVRKLLELNNQMVVDGIPSGYEIHGHTDNSKPVLSKLEKIILAQKQYAVPASTLQVGDKFWLIDNSDFEMYVVQDEPVVVDEITKKGVYFEMRHFGGRHVERIDLNELVVIAPNPLTEEFTSDSFWISLYEQKEGK
jgi:hypothetical protein